MWDGQADWTDVFKPENIRKIQMWTVELVVQDMRQRRLNDWEKDQWRRDVESLSQPEPPQIDLTWEYLKPRFMSDYYVGLVKGFPFNRVRVVGNHPRGLNPLFVYRDLQLRAQHPFLWPGQLEYKGVLGWSRPGRDGRIREGPDLPCRYPPPEDMKVVQWLEGEEGVETHRQGMETWLKGGRQPHLFPEDNAQDWVAKLLRRSEVRVWEAPNE